MKTFITLLIGCLVICTSATQAQVKFKVLAARGTVTVGSGSKVTIGQKLQASDKISIGKGGYASLAHTNGKTIELKKEGSYKVSDLDKKASVKSGSTSSKFASYVVKELTEVDEPISFKENKRANMRTTGSVERAAGDDVSVWDSVLVMIGGPGELQGLAFMDNKDIQSGNHFTAVMPRSTRLLSDTVQFIWHKSPKVQTYKMVVTNRENVVVKTLQTADTTVTMQLTQNGVVKGELYYWHIENANDASYATEEYAMYILDGSERMGSVQTINEVSSELEDSQDAIGLLVVATACEDQGLVYDAYQAYNKAVAAAPGVQTYKRLYAEFLKRQGLNLEAYNVYK